MKYRFTYILFSLLFLAYIFAANSQGRANAQNAGNTGAPGDQAGGSGATTCVTCHGGSGNIQLDVLISITDAEGISIEDNGYTPGEAYTVTVTNQVLSGTPAAFGFQILALNADLGENGSEVSDWQAVSDNVQIAFASNTGRTYAEHDGPSMGNNVFEMTWTAPDDLDGPVTFYSCGNGVNLNGMTTGDGADCSTLTINRASVSSNSDLAALPIAMNLFPNPVVASANLNITVEESGTYTLALYNNIGQLVNKEQITLASGEHFRTIDMQNLSSGIYTIRLYDDHNNLTQKVIKL